MRIITDKSIIERAYSRFSNLCFEPGANDIREKMDESALIKIVHNIRRSSADKADAQDHAVKLMAMAMRKQYAQERMRVLNTKQSFMYSQGDDEMDEMLCPVCLTSICRNDDEPYIRPKYCPCCGAILNYSSRQPMTHNLRQVRIYMSLFNEACDKMDRLQPTELSTKLKMLHPMVQRWLCEKARSITPDPAPDNLDQYTDILADVLKKHGPYAVQYYLPDPLADALKKHGPYNVQYCLPD